MYARRLWGPHRQGIQVEATVAAVGAWKEGRAASVAGVT